MKTAMRNLAILTVGLSGTACLSSCNIVGAAYVLVHGPAKTPAQFTLPKDRPTIIFVDDRANMLGRRSLRMTIAERATEELMNAAGLTKVIAPRAALDATAGESASTPLDIVTLGRNTSSELVIYVTVDEFILTRDGQTITPQATMRVKLLDVTQEQPRVWPEEAAGFTVVAASPVQTSSPTNASAKTSLEEALATQAGAAVARLFYEHETVAQPTGVGS